MPLSIKRRVTLDLSRTGYQITIPFMKSDRVAHEIYITVKDGTEPVILPPGTMAAITVFNGVEGGVVDNLVVDHANNVLMYVPSPNALAVAGNVKCTLTLFDELGAVIGAPSMIFGVMNSDTAETEVEIQAALEASPSWGLIVTAAQSAESAKASANEASQAAVEAYASELHAKFYSEAAQDSEAIVNLYKTDALTYRNVAELKATEAANSAAAAKASEESARADAESVVGARAEINAEINEVRETANEAKAIASGATQALTDRNYAELTERLLAAQRYEFNVGQNFLVETPDVPDVWVVGYGNEPRDFIYRTDADFEAQLMAGGLQIGYVIIAPLESAKVDLTEYAKTQSVNREISNLEARTNAKIGEITGKVSKNSDDITATNARVATAENNIAANAQRITASESDISALANRTAAVESKAIRNDKRLTNLEAGIPDDDFITDESTAYVRNVPTNALPFAEVEEIGGVTRKCTNLLNPDWRKTVTYEGVTFTKNADGSVTANGTATGDIFYSFADTSTSGNILKGGSTYYISLGNEFDWVANKKIIAVGITKDGVTDYLAFDGAKAFTVPESYTTLTIRIRAYAGAVFDNETYYAMLAESNVAVPYEPFFEGLRSAPVYEVVSEGTNIFGGDVLKDKFKSEMSNAVVDTSNKTISYWAIETSAKKFFTDFKPNTQYTLMLKGYASEKHCNLVITYTDGTLGHITGFPADNVTAQIVFVSDPDKSVKSLAGQYFDGKTVLYYDECGIFEGVLSAEDFKPYIKRTLAIPESVRPAHGIPGTDIYDRIRWRYDEASDKWVRESDKRLGAVDMGTLTWNYHGDRFVSDRFNIKTPSTFVERGKGFLCEKYSASSNLDATKLDEKSIIRHENGCLYLKDAEYTDVASLKAALSGVMLVYELATPEITDISHLLPEDNLVGVQAGGTMKAENEFGYDVPMTVRYGVDTEVI